MGDTSKQVRVDNWGVFFLSRLQVFFNKTDYCDLTLQFEGNVQLKVHRLVMNACTEYFQLLEQTCEVLDDVLLMPTDLQADVILPIVNFMYTGMLEFHMPMYEKLYKTAQLMNIPVLLRLLDAQKQPEHSTKTIVSKVKINSNSTSFKKIINKTIKPLPTTLPGRKLPVWKRKTVPSPAQSALASNFIPGKRSSPVVDPLATYDNSPKPTRFEWPDDDFKTFNLLDTSFDSISYTSKPLLTQDEELKAAPSFDDSRCSSISSDDPKEYMIKNDNMTSKTYTKKIKMHEFTEEDVDNDLDDADYSPRGSKRKTVTNTASLGKKVRFSNVNEKENKETRINISGKGELDHSKLISEVLKKYPHLVKKNKNIRLKILAKNKSTTSPEETKVESKLPVLKKPIRKYHVHTEKEKHIASPTSVVSEFSKEGPWICEQCSVPGEQVEFVLYYLYRKHMADMHNEKLDSTLCKFCGYKGTNAKVINYHQYIKHGIMPPHNYVFPKCNKCPFIALSESLLAKHILTHGDCDEQCNVCKVGFNNEASLKQHMQITGHTNKISKSFYDCQYCTKQYQSASILFSHIKNSHQEEARRDGIASIDEEVEMTEEIIKNNDEQSLNKVKVLSDVKLQKVDEVHSMPIIPQTTQTLTNNIATSLGIVDIVVLDDNQQYILHSNNQELQDGMNRNQDYILPELPEGHTFVQNPQVITSEHSVITQSMLTGPDIASTDELVMVLTDHDYNNENNQMLSNDNSNIVVLYSHPVEGQENQFITSQGNLILNSETGMLELQNSNITNTESVVSQANVGESIEMIQQEINSHVSHAKNDLHLVTTTASIVSSVHVEAHPEGEMLQEQENGIDSVTLEEPHEEIDETDGFVVETSETVETEGDDELQTDTVDSTEPEPMEIDEVTSTQEHEHSNHSQVEEIQSAPNESIIIETQESFQEQEEDEEEIVLETRENVNDVVTNFLLKTRMKSPITSEADALSEPPHDENDVIEQLETTDESVHIVTKETDDDNEKNVADTTEPAYIPDSMEVDSNTVVITENIVDVPQEINEEEIRDENESIVEEAVVDDSNTVHTSEEILIIKDISIEPEDNTKLTDNKVEVNQSNVEDNTSIHAEDNASIHGEDNTSIHDENNTSIHDEDSQISVGKDSKGDSSEPAKISILADWDDTDSQQSDLANKGNNDTNAVNKLINDWDDD